MSQLLARGGNRLEGEVTIQSAKNSVLPVLAATILTGGTVELRRCPHLRDVEASIRILQALGCRAEWQGDTLTVDTSGMSGCGIPDTLMREMRSSVIFLGALLARLGTAELSYPGGCELGPGPSTCTCPPCAPWGRRFRRTRAACAAGAETGCGAGAVPVHAQRGGHGKCHAGRLRLSRRDHHHRGGPGA